MAAPGERAKFYETAQHLFADEAPWLTIAHTKVSVPVAKTVPTAITASAADTDGNLLDGNPGGS